MTLDLWRHRERQTPTPGHDDHIIDARSDPAPPAQVSAETANHGEELRELVRLCMAGHVYDVEPWIQNGQPIQALTYNRPKKAAVVSPMRAAIRTKHRDIVRLLLCNGYRVDLEGTDASLPAAEMLAEPVPRVPARRRDRRPLFS